MNLATSYRPGPSRDSTPGSFSTERLKSGPHAFPFPFPLARAATLPHYPINDIITYRILV
jgi:hypothetical protein